MVFCILINFPSPQSSDMPRAYSLLSYFVVQCITFERSILYDHCAALHINKNNKTQKLIETTQKFVIRCLQCKQSTLLRSSFFCISSFLCCYHSNSDYLTMLRSIKYAQHFTPKQRKFVMNEKKKRTKMSTSSHSCV